MHNDIETYDDRSLIIENNIKQYNIERMQDDSLLGKTESLIATQQNYPIIKEEMSTMWASLLILNIITVVVMMVICSFHLMDDYDARVN